MTVKQILQQILHGPERALRADLVEYTLGMDKGTSGKQRAGTKRAQVAPAQHRPKEASSDVYDGAAFLLLLVVVVVALDRAAAPAGSSGKTIRGVAIACLPRNKQRLKVHALRTGRQGVQHPRSKHTLLLAMSAC